MGAHLMAKASKNIQEVHTFNLVLSSGEAAYLVAVLEGLAQSSGYAADIEQSLREAGAPGGVSVAPLAVGDRVRVTDYGYYEGQTGTLRQVDTDDIPYLVAIDDVEDTYWACGVERISA